MTVGGAATDSSSEMRSMVSMGSTAGRDEWPRGEAADAVLWREGLAHPGTLALGSDGSDGASRSTISPARARFDDAAPPDDGEADMGENNASRLSLQPVLPSAVVMIGVVFRTSATVARRQSLSASHERKSHTEGVTIDTHNDFFRGGAGVTLAQQTFCSSSPPNAAAAWPKARPPARAEVRTTRRTSRSSSSAR